MKNIENLDDNMISLIYRGLVKLPYEEVYNLINYITEQMHPKPVVKENAIAND